MKQLKVSIILTMLNNANGLERSLRSIERQSYPLIEVIIQDGESTDNTIEVATSYKQESKYEVSIVSEKDSGIYDAMNKGYARCSGDIIAFCNDELVGTETVSTMVKMINKGGVDCIGAHGDLVYVTAKGNKRYWKMGAGTINQGWMPGHPTLFLKREVYEKYGLYNTKFKISADYDFMIRFLKSNENKLVYFPKVIIRMQYGDTSTGSKEGYWISYKEAHMALVDNGVKGAWLIDIRRTLRVFNQFIRAKLKKADYI